MKEAKEETDRYELVFESGAISCPKQWVASVEIEGDMSDYVPRNDKERAFLEKGYVRYRGRWMSKPGYADELRAEAEERRKRTDELARHSKFSDAWELETKHFLLRSALVAEPRRQRHPFDIEVAAGIHKFCHVLGGLILEQRAIDRHPESFLTRQLDGVDAAVVDTILANGRIVSLSGAIEMNRES